MKILIPASGGVNSAYSLHQCLSNTDHVIVALHFAEGYEDASNEQKEFDAICNWLEVNIRTFKRVYVSLPTINHTDDMRPVRSGFTKKITYAFATARYENYVTHIAAHNADAIAIGISVENTATDRHPILIGQVYDTGAAVYLPSISVSEPVAADADYDTIAAQMSGRFEQLEALPAALRSLITTCDVDTCTDIWCLRCAYQRGYNHYVSTGKTGRDFDLWCAEQGSYGQWRSEADPTDYVWRGGCCDECAPLNYLADLVGREWPSVIESNNRIKWFNKNGIDMSEIKTEEQLGDFCGHMGLINSNRGINSDDMTGDEYWSAILEAAKLKKD
jgi:hypothetical protein